jgi:hypothetical protein
MANYFENCIETSGSVSRELEAIDESLERRMD